MRKKFKKLQSNQFILLIFAVNLWLPFQGNSQVIATTILNPSAAQGVEHIGYVSSPITSWWGTYGSTYNVYYKSYIGGDDGQNVRFKFNHPLFKNTDVKKVVINITGKKNYSFVSQAGNATCYFTSCNSTDWSSTMDNNKLMGIFQCISNGTSLTTNYFYTSSDPTISNTQHITVYDKDNAQQGLTWFDANNFIIGIKAGIFGVDISNISATVYYVQDLPILNNSICCPQSIFNNQSFTILGSNPTGGNNTFSYQWEKSTNGGTSWTSISGATGQDYSFYSLTSATLFRRIVSSGNAIPNTSASVLITIYPPISNNNINGNQTLICGNTYFDPNPLIGNLPSGGNNTFSYYWEYSYNQSTWITIANSNSMSYDPPVISNNNSYQNIYYRRVVKSGSYTSFSNSILVQFQFPDPIQNNSILFQTNDPKVQQGGNHYVSCTSSADPNIIIGSTPTGAGAAIFSYQWMYSIDGGITLLNYAGATSKDFDPPIISQYTLIYRKVMTNNCNIPSVSLPVAVYTQLTQNTICCNNNISCSFDPPILTGNSFNSSPTLFQWQSSIDGMNWNPISGATSANYDPSKISTSMHFRRMATSHASCSFVPSNISTQTLLHPMIEFQETSNPLSLSDVSNADFMLPLDFNRDSYSDIFLSNKMSGNNTIYLNQGNGTFAATNNIINSLSLNENPDNAIVGDFNGDQSEDLFYHWKNTGNNRIFLSNAPATANFNIINNPINATNINENPDYVIVGNFNNDNYSDLFFFWRSTGINRLFINNKNNTFSTYSNPIASSAVNEFSDYLVSGDFNGDSKTDLYFFWKASGTNRLFTTTNTTGIFSYASNPISNAAINENPDYVITGDFGSDTKTDLFIGWKSTGKNLLFLSNGTSFAQTNYPIKATSINENPDYIIPTRLTNSGKNDLLFFWRNTGINKIMTSNGTSFNQCYNYLSICSVNEYPDKILSGKFSSNPYSSLLFTWKSIGRSRIYSTSTNLICNSNYRLNEIGNDLDNSKQYQSQAIAYPNPFTNEITLEFWVENPSTSIIEFYNSLGERVITHQLFSNEGVNSPKISLHNLVPGIYYYKILIDGNQKFSGTLLK